MTAKWIISIHGQYKRYCQKRKIDPADSSSAAQFILAKKGRPSGPIDLAYIALKAFGINIGDPIVQEAHRQCYDDAQDTVPTARTPPVSQTHWADYKLYCQQQNIEHTDPSSAIQYLRARKGNHVSDICSAARGFKYVGIDVADPAIQAVIRECYMAAPE